MKRRLPPILGSQLIGCAALVLMWLGTTPLCYATVTARLSAPREMQLQGRFEVDLELEFSSDFTGGDFEFLNLDIVNSDANGTPLTYFRIVEFEAAVPFNEWQDQTRFGTNAGFESQMMLDAFASTTSVPFSITNTNPVTIGTFSVHYGSLGLNPGDTFTLDITGVDDGSSSRTTSVAIFGPNSTPSRLVNPVFSPGARTITVQSIPEPGIFGLMLIGGFGLFRRRRRS